MPCGDATFGPNYGGATVLTLARAGLLAECPNLARLLRNLEFTPRGESEIMLAMTDGHLAPEAAARDWLAAHSAVRASWLRGVTSFDGRAAGVVADAAPVRGFGANFERRLTEHKVPMGDWIGRGIDWLKRHGAPVFAAIAAGANTVLGAFNRALGAVPAALLIVAAAVLAWLLQRSLPLAGFVAAALLFIMNQGYW